MAFTNCLGRRVTSYTTRDVKEAESAAHIYKAMEDSEWLRVSAE